MPSGPAAELGSTPEGLLPRREAHLDPTLNGTLNSTFDVFDVNGSSGLVYTVATVYTAGLMVVVEAEPLDWAETKPSVDGVCKELGRRTMPITIRPTMTNLVLYIA